MRHCAHQEATQWPKTHNSFETPCGAYAHFKLTRYLLRVTRDARYGDSMERVMYNTILGAKPLRADGRTFYYSDYNFDGRKVYSSHRWPCCSGTFPQIAADYRISAYFCEPNGVYVNLYVASTLRWTEGSNKISLTQTGTYPDSPEVRMDLVLGRPAEFTLNLRIPEWASGTTVSVNGKRVTTPVTPGRFASIRREWRSGDRVELELPLATRLEPLDTKHPNTVALLSGPLVLFAVGENTPEMTRRQLLGTSKIGEGRWQAESSAGPVLFLPFTAIDTERYSTYLKLA